MQHRHKVRLARPEASVQITCLAAHRIDSRTNEAERIIETAGKLGRHDILFKRSVRFSDTFGQVENEVALMDPFRQIEQFADEFLRHWRLRVACCEFSRRVTSSCECLAMSVRV